jgi:hypothetical protein
LVYQTSEFFKPIAVYPRVSLMANPNAQEQELLELVNRIRTAPQAELDLLLNVADVATKQHIDFALAAYGVKLNTLKAQWQTLQAVAPVAWSSELNNTAATHNAAMIAADVQAHQVTGEKTLGERTQAANYNFTLVLENLFAYARSPLEAQAALAIDWGTGTDGIQTPPEHRDVLLAGNVREVGIAVGSQPDPTKQLGPLVVTQNFGNRAALTGKGYLLGVAFADFNNDGWYEAGEGLNDVQLKITGINGTNFSKTIAPSAAGGYQELLDPGRYQVDFLRNGNTVGRRVTTIAATTPTNLKLDLVIPVTPLGSLQNAATASNAIDLRTDSTQDLTGKKLALSFSNVSADAAYHNYAGLYRVQDEQGTVVDPLTGTTYQPGNPGYIPAALRRANQENSGQVQLDNQNTSNPAKFSVDGGYRYGIFVVADGTISQALATTDPAKTPRVYFNYVAANTDGKQHIQTVGANTFAIEDTFDLMNTDYNDLIFTVNAKVA